MNRKNDSGMMVILNPASGAGRTGKAKFRIREALNRGLGGCPDIYETQGPGDATEAARNAAGAGIQTIVVIGGDGTFQEAANGILDQGTAVPPGVRLGFLSTGTGCGLASSLGLPAGIEAQIGIIRAGLTRRIDVGRAAFRAADGSERSRFFLNECQAGIGGLVVRNVQTGHKRLGGFLGFALGSLTAIFQSPNHILTVRLDGGPGLTEDFAGIVAANGNSMAGGMKLAPQARPDDGLFDVLYMHGQSTRGRLRSFPGIYSGRHLDSPFFSIRRARSLSIESPSSVPFEADGEFWGGLPCRIEILPGALTILAGS